MYYPVVCTLLEGIRSLKGRNRNVFCEQKLDFFCCTVCTTILQNADPLRNDGFDLFFWSFSLLGCSVLSVIFCEVVAIYGVIVAIILQTKLESVPASNIYAPESLRVRYAIFASGIIMGFANLVYGSSVQMIFLYVGSCRRRWTTTINEQLEGSF
ncbi:unnamed protein product, partial [Vitis vinifera]